MLFPQSPHGLHVSTLSLPRDEGILCKISIRWLYAIVFGGGDPNSATRIDDFVRRPWENAMSTILSSSFPRKAFKFLSKERMKRSIGLLWIIFLDY